MGLIKTINKPETTKNTTICTTILASNNEATNALTLPKLRHNEKNSYVNNSIIVKIKSKTDHNSKLLTKSNISIDKKSITSPYNTQATT